MKSLKKISFILSLVGIFCLNTISFSWAQSFDNTIEAQDAVSFASKKGASKELLNAISSANNDINSEDDNEEVSPKETLCGDSDTICNENQFCYKCVAPTNVSTSFQSYSTKSEINEKGYCFDKSLQIKTWEVVGKEQRKELVNYQNNVLGIPSFRQTYSFVDHPCQSFTKEVNGFVKKNQVIVASALGARTILKYQECFGGSNGTSYCLALNTGFPEIVYNQSKSFKGCEVLPVKLYNHRTCFFCPLFTVIYRAAVNITSTSFEKLATSFATIIALGLAIWIAFQALTNVSSLTKQDAPKFLSGVIKQSYKFLIAFFILHYSGQFFHYIINPILSSGMTIGENLLTIEKDSFKNVVDEKQQQRVDSIPGTQYYNQATYRDLDTYVAGLQREIAFMQVIGSSLVCTGSNLMWTVSLTDFGDGFQMFIQGAVIAIFGFLLSIAFAFYIMDAVVQLGVVGALMPFLIACWPFKITSKYATTGFNIILNSFFIFVFIGLVISVNMNLIDSALEMTSTENTIASLVQDCLDSGMDEKQCRQNIKNMGGLAKIYIAINNQSDQILRDLTDISGIGFLILIFCCIFGFKFIGQTSSLAGQFASSPMKPIAPSFATMGASAALGTAKKVTKPIREAVSNKAENVGINFIRAIPTAPARLYKGTKKAANAVSNFFRGKKGRANNEAEKAEEKSKNKVGNNQKISNSQAPVPVEQKNNPSEKTTNGTPKVQQGKPREENATDNLEKTLKANESPERKAKNHSEKAKNSSKDNRKRNRDKRKRAHRR